MIKWFTSKNEKNKLENIQEFISEKYLKNILKTTIETIDILVNPLVYVGKLTKIDELCSIQLHGKELYQTLKFWVIPCQL